MSVIAFIPARGGSKSIPLKNIKYFCGKPLIYWTLKAAHDSKIISKIVVATDDAKIEETVLGFSFSKVSVYRRSDENAQDSSSTESVMLEFLEREEIDKSYTFLLIQATSPLLTTLDLDIGLEAFKSHDSILSCVRSKRFFWTERREALNYNYKNRPRRQDFEGLLMENGAFYINSVSNILEYKNRLSGDIGIVEMPEYTAVEIDEEEDWLMAESLMKRFVLKENKPLKCDIKLFVTDVDGVLTDAGMYYSESGDELKKFNTHDGMAFQLLCEQGIKTAIVTSENTKIVENRAKKLKVDYLCQGKKYGGKLEVVMDICKKEKITLSQVAYIGDDINCFELLSNVGIAACPKNALKKIKAIPNMIHLEKKGGEGVVREFVEEILFN
ncbi:acylneuraminate cytidylyltransferase [Flavobacteriaceae bacterium GSB9]|nr:acylneuraminate cytidylyltransferase [Flavobacteriaceae bacterium GSB9]